MQRRENAGRLKAMTVQESIVVKRFMGPACPPF